MQSPPSSVIAVGDGFWNLRSSFRVRGFLDVKTQASLVELESGKYVLLDACDFDDAAITWLNEITRDGAALDAVIHLHPFHTVFVRRLHSMFPAAALYGTQRHRDKAPELPWHAWTSDSTSLRDAMQNDLILTVPRGIELIPANENLHCSSVLAIHPRSRTLHVDDTFTYTRLPKLLRFIKEDFVMVHPTFGKVLEPRAGAAEDFRAWGRELLALSANLENLCAAHSHALLHRDNRGAPVVTRLSSALASVEGKLTKHERRFG
jgi:hypothetical protein